MKLSEKQNRLLEFVKLQHGEQKRKYTGEPYWTHLLNVAEIVSEYESHYLAIEVAICHDLFEDTKCTRDNLFEELKRLGYDVDDCIGIVELVDDLTDEYTSESYPKMKRQYRKENEALRLAHINSCAQSVKYADLIDNTSSIAKFDAAFAEIYLSEKREILSRMKNGNIDLYIKCCYTYYSALTSLGKTISI